MSVFTSALLMAARLQNQSRTEGLATKMWYIYRMDFFSGVKNEVVGILETIISSELGLSPKDKYHMFSLICKS